MDFNIRRLFEVSMEPEGGYIDFPDGLFQVATVLYVYGGITTLSFCASRQRDAAIPVMEIAYSRTSYDALNRLREAAENAGVTVMWRKPAIPYVADLLLPTILKCPQAIMWAGSYARCMGWAALGS